MPKRYPLPEDEPQFPSPSPQSAASSGQAAAATSRELLKGPDMTDVPSPTSSVEDFRKRVDAGVEGISPSWQTAARSGGRMGAQASKVIANTLADQQDTEAKLRAQQGVQQQRDAERLAKETAKAAEDQARKAQAIEARTAAAAGAETEINIENGRAQAKRDAEGNLVFKPGPVGDPRLGITADVSQRSSGILGGDGAIGASGGSAKPAIVQDFRDSSGRSVAEPVKPKTDPKTGVQTVAMKDSFGREVSQTVGIDPKIAKLEDLARRKSMLDLQRQQLEFNEAQVGPGFHDAASKADTAAKKLAALTTKPKFVRNGSGQWVHITDEGRTTYPDPMAVAAWESEVKAAQTEAERLGAAKAKVAPQWEGLQQQKAKLAKAKLDLAQEEVATKWGINPEDSTLSNAISKDDAMQAGMSEPIDFQSAADPNVPPVPTADPYEALIQGAAEASKGAPLLESVAMTSIDRSAEGSLDAARKVLAPFVTPENLAIGQSGGGEDGKGFFLLMNKGGAIGTVTHDAGGAYIELNPGTPNYDKLVNLDTKSGVPVYLGVNTPNRKNPAQTAEWAKQVLSLVDTPLGAVQGPNGEIVEGSEDPRDTPAARAAALRDLGGGLDQISHAASVGEIPIQVAESLAQRLYGASIKPTDPNDKALFAKWLTETSRKEANARLSTNELTVGERFAKGSFTEKNAVRRQFIGDWYAENRGKPGVTRSKVQAMMAEDLASGASLGDKASSAAKRTGDMALNDVGASMLGLIGGMAKDVGAAEVALFGSSEAAAELKKSIQLRNRDFASWTNTANRNRKIWFTGYGQAKAQKLDQAVNELKATIDAEHDSPEPDKAKIDAAERAVRFAALELHQMAPDEDWPITEDSLDPSKDAALGNALSRYIRSADPNEIAVYKERLLMGNGRRQFSAEMEKLTAGKNRFFGAFSGASQAGWQEVGTEIAGDALMIATGTGSKWLQSGLQAAGKVGAATRIARLGTSLSKGLEALEKIGTTADSLVTPLTKGQRITNTAVGIAKTGVKGFVSEGMEEVTAELGSESPKFMDSFLMGGFGGIVLTPAFHVAGVGLNRVLDNAAAGKLKAADAKFASRYNAEFADTPGFQPITPEQASVARGLVNNSEFESIMAEAAAANQAFRVAQAQAVGTVAASTADPAIQKSLDNIRAQREKIQAAMASEGISPDRLTILEAQDSQMAEQEANLAGQIPDQSPVGSAIDRLMQARQQLDAAFAKISEQTVGAVDAINEINGLESPDKQTYYRGIAKVATGNEASLTQNERSAIGGAKTASGAAFFANAPDGRTVLTDDARAELRQTMPALGKLVKTTESEALFEAQVATAAPAEPTPAPAAPAQPAPEVSIDTPTPNLGENGSNLGQDSAPTGAAKPASQPASKEKSPVDKDKRDPAKNPAAIEAADYQSFRSFEPSMPDIPTVVRNAFAAGNPVSVSMANASGVEVPANYQQQGNMLVADPARQSAQPAENPKITQARKLAESIKARIEASTPSLKGRIEILEEAITDSQGNAMASGGAAAAQDGQILVIIPDLVREIAKNSLESIDASLEQVILRHEAVHIAQYDAVRAIWKQQGKPGSFSQFFQSWYGKIATELPAEAMAAGRKIYGAEAWEAISSDANRAAELVRMLIEAKLDPAKADQFSELFRAVQVGYSPTLIETLKQAIATLVEMVRTGKLSKVAQQHLDAVEALYRDLMDAQPQAAAETSQEGLRIEPEPDGKASVRDGDTILWRGPAERAEAALAQMSATDTPMQVTGQAIADAIHQNPSLTAKSRAQLESIAEDLTDALESMPAEQRRAAMDAAISEWVASKEKAKKPKQRQLDAPARTIAYRILNSGEYDALTKLFQSGNKIAPRPNLISLILARKKSGAKLTNKEIRLLENNPEYDGASYQNQFANSGTAKVAREIIGLLMARQGEGTRPEVMAGYLGEGMTASDMWLQLGKELTAIANGQPMAGSELDPNRERTDAEIQQELAKQEAEAGTTDGQNQRFEAANTASNGDAFHVEDFTPDLIGTTVTVDGEPMRVTDVQMDSLGNEAEIVVLDDHARFGRQVLANGDVVYLETENADNVEDGAMFSSPSGSLRERINSAFNLPPSNYEWKPSNERRTSILEIAAANGIELVDSRNLSSATRDFQEATGAIPVFYRGGKPSTAGFVARSSPEVILINVEREDVPISWTLAHELTHVAQKDPAVDSLRLVRQIASLLTRGEMAQIEKYLTDAGYEESSFLSELPAFLIADAVTGQQISGFTEITKLERLNESLVKFFDEIPLPLKPEALRQAADDELSSPLAASPSVPPFYSQLQRTIEAKMPNIAPPAQVMQIAVSGAKAEEVKWSGLATWLQGRDKVTKADVLEWLKNEGSVRFEEVIGRDQSNDDVPQAWETRRQEELLRERAAQQAQEADTDPAAEYDDLIRDPSALSETMEEARAEWLDQNPAKPTRFGQYVLPGGENYREVVLAMPSADNSKSATYEQRPNGKVSVSVGGYARIMPNMDAAREWAAKYGASDTTANYTSSHFPDVPNYVAHMRLNERTDADGQPGLFIEELQSDRHQAGRTKGYKTGMLAARFQDRETAERASKRLNDYGDVSTVVETDGQFAITSKNGEREKIADAPYRKEWPLALFKRALRDAVAAGKEWIGWTVGETQNDRFDLSKQVNGISVPMVNADGSRSVRIEPKDGASFKMMVDPSGIVDGLYSAGQFTGKRLDEVVGKDMAEKIMSLESPADFEGDGLKVGGSGMKGFYDTILPKEIGKYVKQWGGKVEQTGLNIQAKDFDKFASQHLRMYPDQSASEVRTAYERNQTKTPIWRIDITPEMRKGVEAGQALFASPSIGRQASFDFGTTGDFGTRTQTGFSFGTNTPAKLEGEPIDKEWTAFSPQSGTLGIPRAEMPQIRADDRSALVQFLRARGVDYTTEEMLPGSLKPTQAEYSQKKVDKAREFDGGNRSILVSSDGYVVDGHHQWMAKLTDAPRELIPVIRLDAPIRDLLPLIGQMPSATTASGTTLKDLAADQSAPTSTPPIISFEDFSKNQSADVGYLYDFMPRQRQQLAFVEELAKLKKKPMQPLSDMLEAHDKEWLGDAQSGHIVLFQALQNANLINTADKSRSPSQPGQLTDFGRTLSVRKNRAAVMRDITDADLASLPFSKIWPKSEVDSIQDLDAAALAHAVRSEVPRKPTSGYKLTRWVAQVKQVREIMRMSEEIGTDAIVRRMEDDSTSLRQFAHKVRILQQIPREHWDRIGSVQNWPDAYRYVDGKQVPSPYATVMLDDRRITAASLDALVPALLERLQVEPADKKMQFEVRGSERTGFGINKKGDGLYRRLKTFETAAEALAYVRDNNADLVAAWEAVKKSDNVKESDLRTRQNRDRVGPDRRQGRPVTDDMFRRDFGFSGVAFGNWVQQGTNSKERQGMLNLAYDALMDLADVLGIPPRAVSLDGDLGLALGADGSGKFSAHYRPDDLFINLTKTRGAGTLAHEWFHALDHYFQRKRNTSGIKGNAGDYFTQKPEIYYEAKDGSRMSALRFEELKAIGRIARPENWTKIEGVRPAVAEAFTDLVKALDQSPMSARARLIDKGKSDGYWSRIIERAARSFENYVIHKMLQKGYLNDYLANVTPVEEFERDPSRYPYLLDDEIQPVAEAFDNVFQTLDTKETDRGVMLLSSPSTANLPTAAADPAKREKLSQVKIGTRSALGAYRTLTAKREAGKALTADEEQTLLEAEQALGQKMAFDMEALSGPITADPQPPISRGRENGPARSTQQSMELGPETLADGQMTLLASPTLADITTQALASMPPIYRQVFAEVVKTSNADPAVIAAKFGMSEKAVMNITSQVRARVRALTEAASPAGLTPAMIGNQFNGGRPDLALSTNPSVAAVDQIRNQEQIPDVRAQDTVNAEASAMLAKDYEGTYNDLLAKARDLSQFNDTEVAAAKMLISRETIAGAGKTPEERMKLALLIHGYREVGTETARSLAMRRDPHQSPAERHAQYIAEAIYTPDAATRERLRKAPRRTHESILAGWLARVDGIRQELKAQGVDIDASLAAFQQKKEASAQAQVDSPLVSKAVEDAFQKRTAREKMVIQAIREGATATGAARVSGMTVAEIKPIWTGFVSDFRANLQAAAKRFVETVLASSPSSMFSDIEAQFGIFDWDAIDDTKPDFVDRRNEKPRTPRQPKPKPEAAPRQPASPGDMTLEEWAARPPQTWRTLFETEMGNLQPGDRLSFEEWAAREFPESAKSWQSEMDLVPQEKRMSLEEWATRPLQPSTAVPGPALFEDPKAPINETTGTFDLNDPKAVKAVMDAFALARGTKLDALMEFWRMSILSGPQTHLVNAASNTINSAYNLLPRRAAEATVNTLLGLIGQGDVKSASFGEFAGMARTLHKAVQGAARTALRSWELESHVFEAYATAAAQQLDFTGVGGEYHPPALGGKFGKLMRSISFRAMTAADEFQKRLYGELEAAAQAHRIAKQEEKLSGDAYTARVQELMQPGSVAWIRALDESKRITFQQEIDGTNPRAIARLDQLTELAKKGREMPYLGRPLTLFLPFINTPLNVFKQAVEMSPLGGFLAVVDGARALRRKIFRGELSKAEADAAAAELYDRTRLVRDLTNQSLGIMLYFALKGLTEPPDDDEQGLPMITGTQPYKSTKAGERAVAMRTMPPQSIRIGNTMFSYSRVEPFATVLAGTVDAIVTLNRTGLTSESASLYAATFKDQVNDKTFLKGVSDLINAWEEPGRFAENLTGNIITGFIPNLIRQPIREMDDVSRDTAPRAGDGFFASVAKKVGYSIVPKAAPVKMDVWGNPVPSHRGEPLGGFALTDTLLRIVDPTNLTVGAAVDPIDRYIFNYNLQTADPKERLSIMPIDDHVMIDKKKVAITPEQQAEANRRAGKAARMALPTTWDWKAPTAEGIDRIKDAVESAQRGERDRLRAEVRANQ